VPGTIRAALRDERPVLRSDGTFIRDYIFVDDVVDAYLVLGAAVAEGREHGEAFNFSTESRVTALEMMKAVLHAMGAGHVEPLVANTARSEILHQYLDSTKARERLGWTAGHSLEDGLARTAEWYRAFFAADAAELAAR